MSPSISKTLLLLWRARLMARLTAMKLLPSCGKTAADQNRLQGAKIAKLLDA